MTKILLFLSLWIPYNPPYIPIWPGREPIRYCIDSSAEKWRPQITGSFMVWVNLTNLPWMETKDCTGYRTITYRSIPYLTKYDGFAYYPFPLFVEPVAGDIYLNETLVDPTPVLLHETGHAFGMGESWEEVGVMNPQGLSLSLSIREIETMLCLYRGKCQ